MMDGSETDKPKQDISPKETVASVFRQIDQAVRDNRPDEATRILRAFADAQQLDGAQLVGNTVRQQVADALSETLGLGDMLITDPQLPAGLRSLAQEVLDSTRATAEIIRQFSKIDRVVVTEMGEHRFIDMDQSAPKNQD